MFTKVMLLAQRFISYAAIWLRSADGQDTKEQSDLCAFRISQGDAFCTLLTRSSYLSLPSYSGSLCLTQTQFALAVCILQLNMPSSQHAQVCTHSLHLKDAWVSAARCLLPECINSIHLQAKLAKLRRELLEPSTGAGAGGGGKGEGMPSCCDVFQRCLVAHTATLCHLSLTLADIHDNIACSAMCLS